MTMSLKELQELMRLMNRHKLVEFNMKDGDFEISMRSEPEASPAQLMQAPVAYAAPAPQVAPAAPAPAATAVAKAADGGDAAGAGAATSPEATPEAQLLKIKSPMPGTFYRSASPDKPPFTKVGDRVEAGQPVCMIEAMKLFNELESEISGRIVKVLVENAQPVEYDQVLFLVDPS